MENQKGPWIVTLEVFRHDVRFKYHVIYFLQPR